jgi:hypothetical protein
MIKFNQSKKKNKKGQVQYFLESAFRIGFLMIAILAFFLLINFYVHNRMDTNRLQSEVIANRIIYSDIIMLQQINNPRVYTGIIDINKFNDANLDERINFITKRHATAKLTIIDNKKGKTISTAYLNKAQYDNLDPLIGKEGKGAATQYTKNYPITYIEGKDYKYGTLTMNILIPNS